MGGGGEDEIGEVPVDLTLKEWDSMQQICSSGSGIVTVGKSSDVGHGALGC